MSPVTDRIHHAYATAYGEDVDDESGVSVTPLNMQEALDVEGGPAFRDESEMMTPASSTVGFDVRVASK